MLVCLFDRLVDDAQAIVQMKGLARILLLTSLWCVPVLAQEKNKVANFVREALAGRSDKVGKKGEIWGSGGTQIAVILAHNSSTGSPSAGSKPTGTALRRVAKRKTN